MIQEHTQTVPHLSGQERASLAEMLFAGHFLNLAGMVLLLAGMVSYLKSGGTSNGVLETALGVALGVVMLGAGEYFHRTQRTGGAYSTVTAGFCLLFLCACSAHFRHQLLGQEALFSWLLLVVIGSNASVFRYNSKLLGNVMLSVYFLAPLLMTFEFQNFNTIFLYLIAINLGATVVAFSKRWDFQILVSILGSYALYFTHFNHEVASNSLTFLLAIYGLSLVTNYALYFLQPDSGEFNLLLSLVSQVIFCFVSAAVVLKLPTWCPVVLYAALSVVHLGLTLKADQRRKENENFPLLATGSLILSLLYASACISFVTYFSDSTDYFALVTLLWFTMAFTCLEGSMRISRHQRVLGRFSLFGLLLAVVQMLFVLPTMEHSTPILLIAQIAYWCYFALFYRRRESLDAKSRQILGFVGLLGSVITLHLAHSLVSPLLFLSLAAGFSLITARFGLPGATVTLQGLVCWGVLCLPTADPLKGFLGLLLIVGPMLASHRFATVRESGTFQLSAFAIVLTIGKLTLLIDSGPLSTACWALLALVSLIYSLANESLDPWNDVNGGVFDFSRLLYFAAFLKSVIFDANSLQSLQAWQYPLTFLVGAIFIFSGHLIPKREARNLFVVLGMVALAFQATFIAHCRWGDQDLFQPLLSGFWVVLAFFIVLTGVSFHLKVYRLFGLFMLVTNTVKILLVDVTVLDSYSRTNTYLILGALLMMTSFLYQRDKENLRPQTTRAVQT